MAGENGCNNIRKERRFDIDGINYHQCVCGLRNSRFGIYLDLLGRLDAGILPFEGGYFDQPAKIIEILSRLSFLKSDIESRELKKQNKREVNG